MAFLLRRPFIYLIVGIIAVVLIIAYLGILTPKPVLPSFAQTTTLDANQISMGKNATLTVVIENKAQSPKSVGLRVVYYSTQLLFYDKVNRTILPDPVYNGRNYTITYPKTRIMNTGEQWSIPITIKGLDPGGSSYTYTISLELWSENQLSDKKSIQLTVIRS